MAIDLNSLWKTLNAIGPTALKVLEDPALPAVIDRAGTLATLAFPPKPRTATPTAPTAPAKPGVGLDKAVPILDRAIWTMRNKWVIPLAIAGATLTPMVIGFGLGRLSKRSK